MFVQQDARFNTFTLGSTQVIEEDGEHVGVPCHMIDWLSVDSAMHKCCPFSIPEGIKHLSLHLGSQGFVPFASLAVAYDFCTELHGFQAAAQQQLFKAHRPLLAESFSPVNKNPIAGQPF